MPRREAFQAAVDAGAKPSQSVSKRTNYLVVGATDLRKVGETGRSSKHRIALTLAAEGSPVEIIDEEQFICLLAGVRISTGHPRPAADSSAAPSPAIETTSRPDAGRGITDAHDRRQIAPSASRPGSDADRADQLPKQGRVGLLGRLFGHTGARRVLAANTPPTPDCSDCYGTHDPTPEELVAYDPPYEWCEIVKDHKRNGRYDEALIILDGCMQVEEAHSGGVAPWYYEHAAIIHRKRRDRDAELAVLHRFAAQQHAPGAKPPKLLERLAKLETTANSQ